MADGEKNGEKIGRDRDAQEATVAALSREIAAVKRREEAKASESKSKGTEGGGGGLARLSEAKAAVRIISFRFLCFCSFTNCRFLFVSFFGSIYIFFVRYYPSTWRAYSSCVIRQSFLEPCNDAAIDQIVGLICCGNPALKRQEYEKLKADARARGSGQREEMADVERQLASSRSKLDQLRSEQVGARLRLFGFGLGRRVYPRTPFPLPVTSFVGLNLSLVLKLAEYVYLF